MFNTIGVRTFSEDSECYLKIQTFLLSKMSLGKYSIYKARSVQEWLCQASKGQALLLTLLQATTQFSREGIVAPARCGRS